MNRRGFFNTLARGAAAMGLAKLPIVQLPAPTCEPHFLSNADIVGSDWKTYFEGARTFVDMGGTLIEDDVRAALGIAPPKEA